MERENEDLSIRRQSELLALNRSSLYYERVELSAEDQRVLQEMDKIYLDFPIYWQSEDEPGAWEYMTHLSRLIISYQRVQHVK